MEVVGLVVGVVDGDYLMMVEVVEEDCSMNVHARFDTHYQEGLDHRI